MTPEEARNQHAARRLGLNAMRHRAAEAFLWQLAGMIPVVATVEACPPGFRLLVRQGEPPVWLQVRVSRLKPRDARRLLAACGLNEEGNPL